MLGSRSIKTSRVNSLFSKLFIMSSINWNKLCPVELFTWKLNFLFKGPEAKKSPLLLWHNFDFMEKEPCTKFCGALISSYEVTKL